MILKFVKHFFIYFLFNLFTVIACGQSVQVKGKFLTDTVEVGYGKTFLNKLIVKNSSDHEVILVQRSAAPDALIKLPDTLKISAATSKVYPVKYMNSPALFAKTGGRISVNYTDVENGEVLQAAFVVRLSEPQKITIGAVDPIVYLNTQTGTAQFKLHCINSGYSAMELQLKISINPGGIQLINPVKNITLEAGAEQIIDYQAKVLNFNSGNLPDYNITVECADNYGNNLATTLLRITSLGSNKRQLQANDKAIGQISNSVELSYSSLNRSYSYYSLRANGNQAVGNVKLNYNLNLNYYNELHGFDGYDTWLSFNSKGISLTAGNLLENLDFSLYGKGLKSSVNVGSGNSVDLYYVKNDYVLFSQITPQLPGSTTYAGSYNFNSVTGASGKVAMLYNTNPITGTNTRFTNGFAKFALGKNQHLEVRGGYSNETYQQLNSARNGIASGFQYNFHDSHVTLNLNNYYSSPYYSGLLRGVTQLDDQLNYHFTSSFGLFAHYELFKNSPKYLIDTFSIAGYYNNTLKYEAGLNFNLRSFNITLHPYLFKQHINQPDRAYFNIGSPLSSSAIRLGLDMNYALRNNQQISIISDFGYTKSFNQLLAKADYSGFKVNANYFTKWWGLSVLLQNAPYYLAEEAISALSGRQYYAYSIGPNVHYSSSDNKFSIAVNDYLNFTSYNIKRNNALNAQMQYTLKHTWKLSGQVFYNTYSTYSNNYNLQTRVGVAKQFIQTKTPGTSNLELKFFKDENNNGIFDGGDALLEGLIVNLLPDESKHINSDLTTITGKKGSVRYDNLKKATYQLTVVKGNGWHTASGITVNLTRNQKIMVPMVKSGWIKGTIVPVKQQYIASKPLLEGLRVTAIDEQNRKYSTLTDENGGFELPVPLNRYRVTVEANPDKYSINNLMQEINVQQADNQMLTFNLVDESRKVIVRQF